MGSFVKQVYNRLVQDADYQSIQKFKEKNNEASQCSAFQQNWSNEEPKTLAHAESGEDELDINEGGDSSGYDEEPGPAPEKKDLKSGTGYGEQFIISDADREEYVEFLAWKKQ